MSDRPYRPSNGSEGIEFMAHFCNRCERDAKFRETEDGEFGCPIAAASMLYSVDEEGYPKEWVEDDEGYARCTAFEEEVTPEVRAEREERAELEKRGQGRLFA